jgi:hypothetical protein
MKIVAWGVAIEIPQIGARHAAGLECCFGNYKDPRSGGRASAGKPKELRLC